MTTPELELERSYQRLLRLYPATYRRARGDEMLDVLLASAAPGQRRPAQRERRALLLGALRVRAGAARPRTVWESWQGALHAAAIMLLAMQTARLLDDVSYHGITRGPEHQLAGLVSAMVLIALGRYRFAVLATAATLAITVHASHDVSRSLWTSASVVLGLIMLLPLIRRGRVQAPPRMMAVAVVTLVPTVVWLLEARLDLPAASIVVHFLAEIIVALVALAWSVIDERVTLAFGLVSLKWGLLLVALSPTSPWSILSTYLASLAIMPLLGCAYSAGLAWRRARV